MLESEGPNAAPPVDGLRSPPSARDQSRYTIVQQLIRSPGTARSDLIQQTGLSRSTVGRVIDDLLAAGFLIEDGRRQSSGRGRPTTPLRIAPNQGHVIGLDIGVATCRMMASDLNGEVLNRSRIDTPSFTDIDEFVSWLVSHMRALSAEGQSGPLRRLVASVPARVVGEELVERPPRSLQVLNGRALHELLTRQLGIPVSIRRDPDMALVGEMTDGRAVGHQDVAMFVISGALAASVAIDGHILGGRRRVIGELGLMPLGAGPRTLADVLTVEPVLKAAMACDPRVRTLDQLRGRVQEPTFEPLKRDFENALSQMLVATVLLVDPELIVLNGRLLFLVEAVMPSVHRAMRELLPTVPDIALSDTRGYSQPRGAVAVALRLAQVQVLDAILRGDEPLEAP